MFDREMVSGIAFLLVLGGAVVIGILGASVLRRLLGEAIQTSLSRSQLDA